MNVRAPEAAAGRLLEFAFEVPEGAEYIDDLCAVLELHGGGAAVETVHRGPESGRRQAPKTTVRAWVPAEDATARARVEAALMELGRRHQLPAAATRTLARANWAEAWKEHFRPLSVGPFRILPAWLGDEEDLSCAEGAPSPAPIPLLLDPGMAFGTGQHPTTRLCLGLVADVGCAGAAVLDVGCGSGVLAIAAMLLGAAEAAGIDIDADAVRAARANARLNGVEARWLEGGLEELDGSLDRYDVVLANLLAHSLVELAPRLAAAVAPEGCIIASGLLPDQAVGVAEAMARSGLTCDRPVIDGDWAALVARPDPSLGAPMRDDATAITAGSRTQMAVPRTHTVRTGPRAERIGDGRTT